MFQRFFIKHIRVILWTSILIQCLCIVLFVYAYSRLRTFSAAKNGQVADRLVEFMMRDMTVNSSYMNETMTLTKDYRTMFREESLVSVERISQLQLIYNMLCEVENIDWHFFAYDRQEEVFLEITMVDSPFGTYREIRKSLMEETANPPSNGTWYLLPTPAGRIVLSLWTYDGYSLGAWVEEEEFLRELREVDWGTKGEVTLKEGGVGEDTKESKILGQSVFQYALTGIDADFSIQIKTSNDWVMLRMLLLEAFLFLVSAMLAGVLILLMRYVTHSLVVPAWRLTEILDKYSVAGGYGMNQRNALNDAHAVLDQLEYHAKALTETLYSRELEIKQLQLNFRNMQIRPHFFINCLAMIAAMAEEHETEKINKITICLADYYRYLLHDCMDMVELKQEVKHIRNLIRVSEEWNKNRLEFSDDLEEGAGEAKIPVLLATTFVENSIKHAVGRGGALSIQLAARIRDEDGERFLELCISDNGKGFPEELRERLNSGQLLPEREGKHVGINNVYQRLILLYGNDFCIRFSGEKEGAKVTVRLPAKRADEKE